MTRLWTLIAACLTLAAWAGPVQAREVRPPADPPPAEAGDTESEPASPSQSAHTGPLAVAVLDFQIKDPASEDEGAQVAEALTAMLSGQPGIKLVERSALQKTLDEQEPSLTGLTDSSQAVRVGELVGAQILVTGKAFRLGERFFLTGKIIGTETSLVDGLLIRGDVGTGIDELVLELGEKLPGHLREVGPKLIAQPLGPDPIATFARRLKRRTLPTVAVVVSERHYAERPQPVIDPAVETELKQVLQQAGFRIQNVPQNTLADWAADLDAGSGERWPRSLAGVDLVITGEAFSEFLGRTGNLVSCAGRIEVNLIGRQSGEILLAARESTRSVDLSEQIAGKKALQKAGRAVGAALLAHFVQTIPPADPENAETAAAPAAGQ